MSSIQFQAIRFFRGTLIADRDSFVKHETCKLGSGVANIVVINTLVISTQLYILGHLQIDWSI